MMSHELVSIPCTHTHTWPHTLTNSAYDKSTRRCYFMCPCYDSRFFFLRNPYFYSEYFFPDFMPDTNVRETYSNILQHIATHCNTLQYRHCFDTNSFCQTQICVVGFLNYRWWENMRSSQKQDISKKNVPWTLHSPTANLHWFRWREKADVCIHVHIEFNVDTCIWVCMWVFAMCVGYTRICKHTHSTIHTWV